MNDYQTIAKRLEDVKCKKCNGTGKLDDAEPGDTSFKTWTCDVCNGKGMDTHGRSHAHPKQPFTFK